MSLLFEIFALDRAVGRMLDTYMADSPLTPTEYAFYSAIFEDESITPTGLAGRLGMPLTTVMDHVARVEARGHASRMTDARDRRASRVVLTAAGLAAHVRANASFEQAHTRFMAALGADSAAAEHALSALRDAVERAIDQAGGESDSAQASTMTRAHVSG